MILDRAEIPYGGYWSTPFARWQGCLQHLHSLKFCAYVAKTELSRRNVAMATFDYGVLGTTIAQFQSFYGAPWPLFEIGLRHLGGPLISQACATGTRVLLDAASQVQLGMATTALTLTADRISNGPHIYYPNPNGFGGTGASEDQVLYNFAHDAVGGHSMLDTAENVARKFDVCVEEQNDVVLVRHAQYEEALVNDRAFHKRFMSLPFDVPSSRFKGIDSTMLGDEGVRSPSADQLRNMKPVLPHGSINSAGQTFPADGNCGMIIATPERARELSTNPLIRICIRAFGHARADLGYMPEAPIIATKRALANADLEISNIHTVKSHNPFVVNDIAFSKATNFPIARMNNFGCSLTWGHPQGPTATRAIIELIEELAMRGGGIGLFQGCAAGDSSIAVVIDVRDR